ncbi:Aste57867_25417 [Aphanomyces stellatus]|uniref:Aste57867_25417 protein n=1 Tax=Aphanomyces stellatus TaxID=120398 RepID=A0A485LT10_9STRA|nr:hypothetical protein As57867_025338 [Aphanomyces stellatus]VFU02041.1 Aste57867_25417 [Aphanomyces stellatus]
MGNQVPSPRSKKKRDNAEGGGIMGFIQGEAETCPSKLTAAMFAMQSVGHHGLPSQPSLVCYVPTLGLLAVATGCQQLKVYGQDGLEVYLPCRLGKTEPPHGASAGAKATFLEYTHSGKLVLVMSDSAIQVIDLTLLQDGKNVVVAELPPSWTTSRITAVETMRHPKAPPFFYVALDDGSVQVVEESTCHFATYAIHASDIGISAHDKEDLYVSAMAVNPADPNQLLLAYEASDVVFLWDVAKQKVMAKTLSSGLETTGAVRSLAWHASGKRFAIGFQGGELGISRADKQQQALYRVHATRPPPSSTEPTTTTTGAPISRVEWLTTSASSAGAIVFCGGHDPLGLTVCFPAREKGVKEALGELTASKASLFPWHTLLVPTHNNAGVMDFVATARVVPASSSSPFSCVVLAGNPLDGLKPSVGVVPLPCIVAHPHTPKEEWMWLHEAAPPLARPLSSAAIQASDVLAMQLVSLGAADGTLRDDLFTTCDHAPEDTTFQGWESPLIGGAIEQVQPKLPAAALLALDAVDCRRATLVVTGHADSRVKVWEMLPPADATSRGVLTLLHVVDVTTALQGAISAVSFAPDARLLLVGTTTGEFGVFSLQEGFQFVFSLHVHSGEISTIVQHHEYVALADAFGVVSIVHLATQSYKLAIFDIATTDEPVSVDSLLIHDGGVLFVGRGNGHVQVYHLDSATFLVECNTAGHGAVSAMLLIDEDGAPIVPAALPEETGMHEELLPVDAPTQAMVDGFVAKLGVGSAPATATAASTVVSVCLEPGPLGIFLHEDVDDKAVLRGFVPEDPNALLQEAKGIVPGSVLVKINGVDVRRLKRQDIIAVVGSLGAVAKHLTYALPTDAPAPFLVCAMGRSIQLFQAVVPPPPSTAAADDATKPKPPRPSQPVDVEAEVQVRATVVSMSVCSIPVEGAMEHSLIVLDQSGYVYVLALPSLHLIWSAPCPTDLLSGYAFDHLHVHITASGEIVLGTFFGDIARYSIFAPDMATEVTMLQWAAVHTTLHVAGVAPIDQAPASDTEKRASTAGGFLKLFAAKEVDLNTVFVVPSVVDEQRKQLMGDRVNQPPPAATVQSAQGNLSGTKDALAQAAQNLQLRGEKLSGLEEKTEKLKNRADEFYQTMKAFNEKEAKKKWYQL